MPSRDIAQELFKKLVKKEQKLAERCIKETVDVQEMNEAVKRFMKSAGCKKILSKDK